MRIINIFTSSVQQVQMHQRGAQAYKTVCATPAFRDQMGARVLSVAVESISLQQGQMLAPTVRQANTQGLCLQSQIQCAWHARRAQMRQLEAQAYKTVYVTLAFRDQMGARVHSVLVERTKLQQGQMLAPTVRQANTQGLWLQPQIQRAWCVRKAQMRQRGAQTYKTVYVTPAFRGPMEDLVLSVAVESIKLQQGQMHARTVGQANTQRLWLQPRVQHVWNVVSENFHRRQVLEMILRVHSVREQHFPI
tara:strand:- start:2712 stop:3458 length:747 start_codon:yes stop_codon:yes gene_type:complete